MTKAPLAALCAVILLGAAVRFAGLGRESLWTDEVLSVQLARRPWPDLVAATREDGHPPLYAGALRIWIRTFGESDAAVRGLSALAGVLALPLMFLVASRLLPTRGALLGTLLLGTSPYHIYYSQEARNYALLVLLTLASYAALLAWDERPTRARAALYVSATLLLLYTHVFALFVWGAQVLWVAARHRKGDDRARRALPFAAIALLLLPWLAGPWAATLLRQSSARTTGLRLLRPTVLTLLTSAYQFCGSPFAAVVVLPTAVLEVYRSLRSKAHDATDGTSLTPRSRTGLLLLWLLTPQVVPFLVSQVSVPVYITRATIVGLPALYLLAAAFLVRLPTRAAAALAAVAALGSLGAQLVYVQHPSKDQWREVAAEVDARARPDDVVVFDAAHGRRPFDYYSRRPELRKVEVAADITTGGAPLPEGARRVWVIRFQRPRASEGVAAALAPRFRPAGSGTYQGIELYLFESASDARP